MKDKDKIIITITQADIDEAKRKYEERGKRLYPRQVSAPDEPSFELDDDTLRGYDRLEDMHEKFMNAVDLASDQDKGTWLKRDGKRVAKIVPVSEAEAYDEY